MTKSFDQKLNIDLHAFCIISLASCIAIFTAGSSACLVLRCLVKVTVNLLQYKQQCVFFGFRIFLIGSF